MTPGSRGEPGRIAKKPSAWCTRRACAVTYRSPRTGGAASVARLGRAAGSDDGDRTDSGREGGAEHEAAEVHTGHRQGLVGLVALLVVALVVAAAALVVGVVVSTATAARLLARVLVVRVFAIAGRRSGLGFGVRGSGARVRIRIRRVPPPGLRPRVPPPGRRRPVRRARVTAVRVAASGSPGAGSRLRRRLRGRVLPAPGPRRRGYHGRGLPGCRRRRRFRW